MSSFIVSIHLFFCLPLHRLPPTMPSIISFSNESCRRILCPKYDNFNFTIEASSQHSGFIFCKTDLLVLFSVHATRSILLQHQSSKASIFLRSACFIVQLSHPYVVTGKTIVLVILILVAKLTCLLLMSLSRLTIAFLPTRSLLFISLLQLPSAFILEPCLPERFLNFHRDSRLFTNIRGRRPWAAGSQSSGHEANNF